MYRHAPYRRGTGECPAILSVGGLSVEFGGAATPVHVVREVTFTLTPGETLALVGESGCGKSMTALAVLGLLPRGGRITSGHAVFNGKDLVGATGAERRVVRGAGIGMVFQEPSAALSPVLPIGDQIAEALVAHARAGWTAARARAIELLEAAVGQPLGHGLAEGSLVFDKQQMRRRIRHLRGVSILTAGPVAVKGK